MLKLMDVDQVSTDPWQRVIFEFIEDALTTDLGLH